MMIKMLIGTIILRATIINQILIRLWMTQSPTIENSILILIILKRLHPWVLYLNICSIHDIHIHI